MKIRMYRFLISYAALTAIMINALPSAWAGNGDYAVGMQSVSLLERAEDSDSHNYAIPFYLGMVYLNRGEPDRAIDQWE